MTAQADPISNSLEDYMEAIFHIQSQKQAAKAKDIAERLQVSNSSVTGALRLLADKGLINYAPYDLITLTSKGKEIARTVVRKHTALLDFFVNVLRIEPEEAEAVACKMEHGLSDAILARIKLFMEFLDACPPECSEWLKQFETYCQTKHIT